MLLFTSINIQNQLFLSGEFEPAGRVSENRVIKFKF